MRWSFAVSVLAAVLLIAAPARADDDRNAIEAAKAKMVADYSAGDAKALALAYTEDAMMLPPDATRVVGHAAIEALWKSWIEPDPQIHGPRNQRRSGLRGGRPRAANAC